MTFKLDKLIGISMVIIRKGKIGEIKEIGQLWTDFMNYNSKFNDSFAMDEEAFEVFLKDIKSRCKDSDCYLSVAEKDGELVGFCYSYVSAKPKYFRLKKFGFIGDLFVKEAHRRIGIGGMLVTDAMEFFEKKKVHQVELLVAVGNNNTFKFWEKYGFKHLLTWMYKRK